MNSPGVGSLCSCVLAVSNESGPFSHSPIISREIEATVAASVPSLVRENTRVDPSVFVIMSLIVLVLLLTEYSTPSLPGAVVLVTVFKSIPVKFSAISPVTI